MRRYWLILALLFASTANAQVYTHDLLVLYTQKAATRLGVATIRTRLDDAITLANAAHTLSGTNIHLRVIGFEQTAVVESGNFTTTGVMLTQDAAAKNRRNQLGADFVLLISEDTGCGGWGQLSWSWNNGTMTALESFAVVTSNSLPPAAAGCGSDYVVAHEVGHMQGLAHNREDAGTAGTQAGYNFGYRVCAANGFRDIMSYGCPTMTVTVLGRFSDPKVTYNGYPIGIDYAVDPTHAADASRQLRENAPLLANFRTAAVKIPNPPTNLTVN